MSISSPAEQQSSPSSHDGGSSSASEESSNNNEAFQIKICIDKCNQLVSSSNRNNKTKQSKRNVRNVWLSYRFQHSVVQSEIFVISSTKGDERYKPMMHTFRFQECSLRKVRVSLAFICFHLIAFATQMY